MNVFPGEDSERFESLKWRFSEYSASKIVCRKGWRARRPLVLIVCDHVEPQVLLSLDWTEASLESRTSACSMFLIAFD